MKILLFDNFEEIKSHRQEWDRLAGSFPFYRWAWMGNWFECLANNGKPIVLVGVEDGRWIGIAPFWIDDSGSLARKLRFWGDGKACTDYANLFAEPDFVEPFTLAVVDWLSDECAYGKLQDIDVIELDGVMPESNLLLNALDASEFNSHARRIEGCWVTDLAPTWDEFSAGFGSSMRRKSRKATKRVSSETCEIKSSNDDNFESLWADFVELHQKRRQMLGEEGCFADPVFETFLRLSSRELFSEGRGELVLIYVDDKPLTTMLLFNDGHTNYMYQSGADSSRMKLEPGYQISQVSMQKSIEQGLKHFDFLRGDEPYKARWLARQVPLSKIRFIPQKFRSRLKHNVWLTGHTIKNYLRAF